MARKFSTGLRNALLQTNCFKTIFANGVMEIYSGSQPADADAAETGSKLVRVTLASGAFTPGNSTNGINFGTASAGVLGKSGAEVWSGVGLALGTAGWFRFYTNAYTTGASGSAVRFDGSIGTSGAQLNLASLAFDVGTPLTIDAFNVTLSA